MTMQAETGAWVPLAEAASRLGVPAHNLRLAIDGGLLQGRREEGGWQVQLRLDDARAIPFGLAEERGAAQADPRVTEIVLEQVDYLRRSLDRRDDTLAEKDALLADLARGILAHAGSLAAGVAPVAAAERPAGDERVDLALRNVRETLLLVRDYLQRLRTAAE